MEKQDKPLIIRQGDVLLVQTDAVPADEAKPIQTDEHRTVLAHGEVTGHAHAIYHEDPKAVVDAALKKVMHVEVKGEHFLQVKEPVALKHEEHTAPQVPPGNYFLPIQVDANVGNGLHTLRRVAD